MFKFATRLIIASFALLITSCEKDLDIEYHDIDALPVIEAVLTQEGASVAITYTTPMDEPMDYRHLTDASVSITDLTSGDTEILAPDSEGYFRSFTPGVPGHEYKVTATFRGNEYVSFARMQSSVELESAKFCWVGMPGDDMAVLQIRFSDFETSNDYYWIRVYRNDKPYCWSVTSDHGAADGIIEEAITTTHRDVSQEEDDSQLILDGDTITVQIYHIDRKMCDYLVAIQNGNNGGWNFSTPGCLGYFLASEYAETAIIYHPDEIEYAK